MTDKIKCANCGSDSYEIQTGPDGEHYYSIVCVDCGSETIVDDAMRAALQKQPGARGKSED